MGAEEEIKLEVENAYLRGLLEQAGADAVQRNVAEQLQRVLLEELHHRVKNTLATVQAITSQSLRTAETTKQASDAITSRLQALGRVHDILLRTSWGSTKLAEIIDTAIAPFDTAGASQFASECADLEIGSAVVLPLAMVLNELCTNAVKYGALSTPQGQVRITCKVVEASTQFLLTWIETNGPTVQEPTRRSFGLRLIEQSFAGQIQGRAHVRFEPAGVVCELNVPLANRQGPISN